MKSNRKGNNNILVAILFIIIVLLAGYILFFNAGSGITTFYTDLVTLQKNISYYLGTTSTEMFDVYSIENIITGFNDDNKEIKNIDEENIVPIGIKDSVIQKGEKKYYKLNSENIKTILKIELPTHDGIEWYISQDGQLAIKLTKGTPKWWNDNLDELRIS